jgi:hypothetical protein
MSMEHCWNNTDSSTWEGGGEKKPVHHKSLGSNPGFVVRGWWFIAWTAMWPRQICSNLTQFVSMKWNEWMRRKALLKLSSCGDYNQLLTFSLASSQWSTLHKHQHRSQDTSPMLKSASPTLQPTKINCPFYRISRHASVTAHKACMHRHIPWQLLCSGTQ